MIGCDCGDHEEMSEREAARVLVGWLRKNKSWIGGREQRFIEDITERMADGRPAVAKFEQGA